MKRLIQFTVFTLLGLLTGVMAQVSTSKWQPQSIVIDGNGSDWGSLPRFFNAESNVKYEFRNDARNLYIILKAADRSSQMQLLMAGFNVKLKVKTSPPIKVGINFPALRKGEMPPMIINPDGKPDKLTYKTTTNDLVIPKDTAILDGFLFSKGKITSESNDEKSICFARSKLNRELITYEIRIPLREVFGNEYTMENVSANAIQLQVSINELSQKDSRKGRKGKGMSGGMHGGGGGRGMGGGGMEGGGGEMGGMGGGGEMGEMPGQDMQGGMQGGMQESSGSSMERKSFSIDFKLSTGKE